jgi:hypothetical protein
VKIWRASDKPLRQTDGLKQGWLAVKLNERLGISLLVCGVFLILYSPPVDGSNPVHARSGSLQRAVSGTTATQALLASEIQFNHVFPGPIMVVWAQGADMVWIAAAQASGPAQVHHAEAMEYWSTGLLRFNASLHCSIVPNSRLYLGAESEEATKETGVLSDRGAT